MEQIKKILEQLHIIDENWLNTVKAQKDNDTISENGKMVSLFNELWHLMRESMKKDYDRTISFFEEYVGSDGNWLLEAIYQSLQVYFSLSYFRELQKKDPGKGKKVINYLWENAVLLFDPQFANMYLEFGFDNSETFVNTARTLDGLVSYYVHRHFTMSAIKKDLKDETEFEDCICDYIITLIQDNYQMLQLNIIIDGIEA